MPYVVYILRGCDGTYYVGQTQNLEARLNRHNSGRSPATKARGSWRLVYVEEFPNRAVALARERQIKTPQSRIYIERLVRPSRA